VTTIEAYGNWIQGLHTFMSDASYEIKRLGTDNDRNCVVEYVVFSGTHTGEGSPVPRPRSRSRTLRGGAMMST